ncbi:MAG TPA: hypothetical protein VHA35_09615 [Dongiaceae bacterium]|nr:hypothetical protein [Dongiaceae bacterium]
MSGAGKKPADREELADGIAKERGALRRKLAQIRRWLGTDPEGAEGLAVLVGRVREQISALPDEERRLFHTAASLAVADLRDSEDALKHYLAIVKEELTRRGAHAAAANAYGTLRGKAPRRRARH